MISIQDRRYFIDPVQPPSLVGTRPTPETTEYQVMTVRYRREGLNTPEKLGRIITCTRRADESGEVWWVDELGDYFHGAQAGYTQRQGLSTVVLGVVSDDLFIVGRWNGNYDDMPGGHLRGVARSDGKKVPFDDLVYQHASMTFKAAPWAEECMPQPEDTDAIVAKKVELAKLKFENRQKVAAAYREGIYRNWFDMLEEIQQAHTVFPKPRYNVAAEGEVLMTIPLPENAYESTGPVRDRVRAVTVGQGMEPRPTAYLATPFRFVTPLTVTSVEEMRELDEWTITSAINQMVSASTTHGRPVIHQRKLYLNDF